MTKEEEVKNKKSGIIIDPALNKYRNKILFAEKLALANEQLKDVKLPSVKKTDAK